MALRGGLEMVPARSHKPITRVQIPLSQFRCRRSSAGKEQLFRKQQAAGSKPAAGFQTYDKRALGLQGVAACFASRKNSRVRFPEGPYRLKAVTKRELYTQLSFLLSVGYILFQAFYFLVFFSEHSVIFVYKRFCKFGE